MIFLRRMLPSGLVVSMALSLSTGFAQELDSTAAHLLEQVRAFTWQVPEKDVDSLNFKTVVKETLDSDAMKLSEARVEEARAEAQKLKSQNSLLFVLISPRYLAEAGEEQVKAALSQHEADRQKALLENTGRYFDLMNAEMAEYVAYYQLQTVEEQLRLDESRFKLGEVTSLTVIQSQNALLQAYQDFQKAGQTVSSVSLALSGTLGDDEERFRPEELKLSESESRFVVFPHAPRLILPTEDPEERLLEIARSRQPELAKLRHQREALEHLLEGSGNKNDPQHKTLKAQLEQVKIGISQAEALLSLQITQALRQRVQAEKDIELAHAQLALARKALHHVRVSQQSGFSNNKDLFEAQATLIQTQAGFGRAHLAQIRQEMALMQTLGLLKPELLLGEQPITLKSDQGQI